MSSSEISRMWGRKGGVSCFGILLVYGWVTVAATMRFGEFAWPGLALMAGATGLAMWLHWRPRLRGPADGDVLAGMLVAWVGISCFLMIGQTLRRVPYVLETLPGVFATKVRLDGYGMAIRFLTLAAFAAALTYLVRGGPRVAWWARWRFGGLIAAAVAMRVLLLMAAPNPDIDVHVLQEVGARGLLEGRNVYTLEFPSPYEEGVRFKHYCYPPATAYATAAAWVMFKEIRAAWLICDVLGGLFLYLVARRVRPGDGRFAELVALVFLFMPRSLYVLEKAWTEPLAAASLGAVVYAMVRGARAGWTGFLLGFWLCSKQYVVLGIPGLVKLRRWPAAAWVGAMAAAVLLMVPFALWDFGAFFHDLVGFFLTSRGRPDALSIYGALMRFGYELPWTVVVPVWVAGMAFFTWRMRRTVSGWLFATAGTWMLFFMFGKQAFMNYFYLIGYALLLAVAANQEAGVRRQEAGEGGLWIGED